MSTEQFGFGCMRLPTLRPDNPASFDHAKIQALFDAYLEQGFTYFDTAYTYHGYHGEEAVQADRVVVVDDGQILLDGTPREVFSQVKLLKSVELDVPQATRLLYRLEEAGVQGLPKGVLDDEECIEVLSHYLEVHGCR